MLNQLTESEVTELTSLTVNDTALAILKSQGSRGITIVGSQRKFIFDIWVNPYWLKWQTKRSKLAAKDFKTLELHHDTWNRNLILGFLSAYIGWKAISNLELGRSYAALQSDLVLSSTMTGSNMSQREYALTLRVIKKQLQLWNKLTLALDGWTSTLRLATTSVITNYMDQNWALWEVQLAFNEVDHLFCFGFES